MDLGFPPLTANEDSEVEIFWPPALLALPFPLPPRLFLLLTVPLPLPLPLPTRVLRVLVDISSETNSPGIGTPRGVSW